jgi:hypothetical protein
MPPARGPGCRLVTRLQVLRLSQVQVPAARLQVQGRGTGSLRPAPGPEPSSFKFKFKYGPMAESCLRPLTVVLSLSARLPRWRATVGPWSTRSHRSSSWLVPSGQWHGPWPGLAPAAEAPTLRPRAAAGSGAASHFGGRLRGCDRVGAGPRNRRLARRSKGYIRAPKTIENYSPARFL